MDKTGFKRVSDDTPIDITELSENDCGLYYKEEPYTPQTLHQRLIITYSPKFARYQRTIRENQAERAKSKIKNGEIKRNRKNPTDPARFIEKTAVTKDGEKADI